jgi:Arc/MetJ-type ribon-helix-helix transcriptional regulator
MDRVANGGVMPTSLVAVRITFRHTDDMAKAISVRLDEETERALQMLESSGLTRSEAIRSSLLASAARLRRGRDLAAEAAALEADEADRQEMLAVASLMESMRAPG